MTTKGTQSARRLTLLLTASSAVAFALGILRTKLLAFAWGPVGIGQMGLMQAAMGTANLATGLGVDGLVARDVAASGAGSPEAARVFAAATRGATLLSLLASLVSTGLLAWYLASVSILSLPAALVLGCGAGVSILAANFRALLSGLGAGRETAIATMVAAAISLAGAGVLALMGPRHTTLALAVAMVPTATMLALGLFVARHAPAGPTAGATPFRDLLKIAKRASIFTLAGVLPLVGQSAVRTLASSSLTEAGLGQMQAAAAIAALSTSLLASSIGPVLIPQLSAAINNRKPFAALLTEHSSFLVSIYAPVAILTATAPGLALTVLYSSSFSEAAPQLGWQITGEVLRLPVWLMATSLVVLGRGRAFFLLELVGLLTQVFGMMLVLPQRSPALIGVVFALSSLVQFVLATALLWPEGFRWSRAVLLRVAALSSACGVLALLCGQRWGLVIGAVLAVPATVGAARLVLSLRRKAGD